MASTCRVISQAVLAAGCLSFSAKIMHKQPNAIQLITQILMRRLLTGTIGQPVLEIIHNNTNESSRKQPHPRRCPTIWAHKQILDRCRCKVMQDSCIDWRKKGHLQAAPRAMLDVVRIGKAWIKINLTKAWYTKTVSYSMCLVSLIPHLMLERDQLRRTNN